MSLKRLLVQLFAVGCTLLIIACGDSSKPVSVTVTPSIQSTTVSAGSAAVTLNATVANDKKNGGVSWALSPSSGCGTLSGSGSSVTYTPPAAATLNADCTATITATSADDSTKTGNVALTIKAIAVAITSSSGTTTTFGSGMPDVTLTASLNNEASGANDTVTWSISSTGGAGRARPLLTGLTSGCGTLSASTGTTNKYTAPTSLGSACTATITAASTINSHQTKTVTFTVNPIAVTITGPANPVTEFADKGAITLTSSITNDGANAGLTWTVAPASGCGTVSGNATSATYTPPSAPSARCTAVVTATSVTDSSKSASAPTFTINPIVSVALGSTPGSLAEGATTGVSATVTNDLGTQGVTFAVSPSTCGSLTNVTATSATYNTPTSLASACTATVTATSKADAAKIASASIAVNPTSVSITSPSGAQNLAANAGNVTVQAAITNDGSSQGMTWSMSSSPASPACGTLTPNGTSATYAPPTESGMSAACTATVKAASTADSQHFASVAITENPVSLSAITGAPSQGVAQHSSAITLSTSISNDATSGGVGFTLTSGASCGSLGTVGHTGNTFTVNFTPAISVSSNCVATIGAQSVYDGARQVQANVTVLPLTVSITNPASSPASVTVNATQTLTATTSNDVGNGGATWALNPLTGCGTLTGTGSSVTFNAPAVLCSVVATATAVDDNTKLKSVTLNVVAAPISVGISPAGPYTLDATNNNGQSQLNLNGTIQNDIGNAGISWSVSNASCGSVVSGTSGGVPGGMATFTAASDSGLSGNCVTNIIATSVYDPTKKAQYQATVYPISVSLSPNTQQAVTAGGQPINFTATVNNDAVPGPGTANSSAAHWGVTWSFQGGVNNCGTLTNQTNTSATYTPPASGPCQVTVQAASNADGSKLASTQINVSASSASDGKHNSYLNGRYSCVLNGYLDSDSSRWASLVTFVADGSGHITSGSFTGSGRTLGSSSGTFTGTYSVDTSNNALFNPSSGLAKSGVASPQYIMALNKVTGTTADTIRLIEADDLGANPSGMRGNGVCYLTATSFSAYSGGYVFSVGGEDGSGAPKGAVGQISINTNTIVSGTLDQQKGNAFGSSSVTGSVTTPDSSGHFTGSITAAGKTNNWAFYVIDANRALMMQTDSGGASSGQVRKQQQSNYSMAQFQGPLVAYGNGADVSVSSGTVSEYGTLIAQGTGSGSGGSGTLTFHTSVQTGFDTAGNNYNYTLNASDTVNLAMPVTVTSNGRLVITQEVGAIYAYLYDNNTAVFLDASGDGVVVNVGLGWAEPQSGSMTDSAIAGSYMFGDVPEVNAMFSGSTGVVSVASTGGITGTSSDASQGVFNFMSPLPSGITYTWDGNVNSATGHTFGSYGLIDINQGGEAMNCISITTGSANLTNRFVCSQQSGPNVMVMQQ